VRVGGIAQSLLLLLSNAGCECKCNSRRLYQRRGEEDCSSNTMMIPHGETIFCIPWLDAS
jgi:hypothetical protein